MALSIHSSAREARQLIADRLRELREQAGLSGRDLAAVCGWHPSKTSRIEHNRTAPSADDLRSWCRACGVEDQAVDLVASLRTVEGMFVEWQRLERSGLRQAQESVRPIFERTRRFRAYSSWLIPGMIQTRSYIEQVLRAAQRRRHLVDDVEDAVAVRLDRQRLLNQASRTFAFLLEESTLHSDICDAEVMVEQLRHLIKVAQLPNVSLGVVASELGRHHRPVEGFWIYGTGQVQVELVSGHLTITQPREVDLYARTFAALSDQAVRGTAARRLIDQAIQRHRQSQGG
ncbi:helix-turn-helix domain-containing protein [Microlunatus sp. GCM10028923]|uniref:helix-turn-helix domain-containing protein n=1 Tax=Microlunatus sp. GCM10028923 TaxID=3273400 RepID=UPI003617BB48